MDTLPELVAEMHRLIGAANERQIQLRAFGGLAILEHSRDDPRFFQRDAPDIDLIIPKNERHKLESFFRSLGYSPDKQFNLLNGMRRQIYHRDSDGLKIDILVGDFEMCHKLPLDDRLHVHPVTIPLAELLLSKAQIVELNRKDAFDILSLLLNNEVGLESEGKIGVNRIAWLCAQEWGLHKTTSINLKRAEETLLQQDMGLDAEKRESIISRIGEIQAAMDAEEKPLAWRLRDRVGTRVRWYSEVEEVDQ
ncbi:MAG TPA: nucleotidyltransferase family protein [Anaerolineales bacterium]|nr:nucleotidyltransferase family protein [Anaerolineales bacterium]